LRELKITRKLLLFLFLSAAASSASAAAASGYPIPLDGYPAASGFAKTVFSRISYEPFNLFATAVFFLAVIHTLCHGFFTKLSHRLKESHSRKLLAKGFHPDRDIAYFPAEVAHLLGEVEVIFALWLIPLFIGFVACFGWGAAAHYIDALTFEQRKYTEPLFVVVVMCMASTRPIIQLSGDIISRFARIGGGTVGAWWVSILAVGPMLGSFVTEPAAITICATLLARKFYAYSPSSKLSYATIGLLFAAISAGGTLTHFAAPPVLMVVSAWDWDLPFMFFNFGWKAAIGIFISVGVFYFAFRPEFAQLQTRTANALKSTSRRVPLWIVAVHVGFLVFTVLSLHHPAFFLFGFLLFLAFVETTRNHQYKMEIKNPFLVGLFLAALVTHGSLQAWWIEPALTSFSGNVAFAGSLVLTAFNDNAAITYLCTLVPNFEESMRYMVVAGAVAGGGLTVIANAPNPAGIAILREYFGGDISALKLLAGAAVPTAIISAMFFFIA